MREEYKIMRGKKKLLVEMVRGKMVGEIMGWKRWIGIVII